MVRLRSPHDKTSFLPWHDVLGTLVHELTHMKIGAHSAEFYALLDELYTEVEKDEDSGLIHSFDGSAGMALSGMPSSKGNRLGGASGSSYGSGGIYSAGGRVAALKAAENRLQHNKISGGSSNRLGSMGSLGLNQDRLQNQPIPVTKEDKRRVFADRLER